MLDQVDTIKRDAGNELRQIVERAARRQPCRQALASGTGTLTFPTLTLPSLNPRLRCAEEL